MPRPRLFKHNIWLKVSQLERAIVEFYAETNRRNHSDIIRGMIKQYTRADTTFDTAAFRKFVRDEIVPEAENDPEMQDDIKRRVEEFTAEIEKRRT